MGGALCHQCCSIAPPEGSWSILWHCARPTRPVPTPSQRAEIKAAQEELRTSTGTEHLEAMGKNLVQHFIQDENRESVQGVLQRAMRGVEPIIWIGMVLCKPTLSPS